MLKIPSTLQNVFPPQTIETDFIKIDEATSIAYKQEPRKFTLFKKRSQNSQPEAIPMKPT